MDSELRQKIGELAQSYLGDDVSGLAIGVLADGEESYFCFGRAREDSAEPPNAETIFEIGSITKVMTALLLAEMAEREEVALDDPVANYLPAGVKAPSWGKRQIRLRDLATHLSSLPRLPTNLYKDADPEDPYAHYGEKELYEFLSNYPLMRPIGSRIAYSNLGYGLLGHALELRAGKPYGELLRERLFEPLGMRDAFAEVPEAERSRFADGHDEDGMPAPHWHHGVLQGDGVVCATVRDLIAFARAQLEGAFAAQPPSRALPILPGEGVSATPLGSVSEGSPPGVFDPGLPSVTASRSGNDSTDGLRSLPEPLAKAIRRCMTPIPSYAYAPSLWLWIAPSVAAAAVIFALYRLHVQADTERFFLAVSVPVLWASLVDLWTAVTCVALILVGGWTAWHGGFAPLAGAAWLGLLVWITARWRSGRPGKEVFLGWQFTRICEGLPLYWHNGGTGGFASFLGVAPDRSVAVAVLSSSERDVDDLAMRVLNNLLGK